MARDFCSCEEIQMMFEQILTILKEAPQPSKGSVVSGERRKHAPSKYNIHIKECMTGGQKSMKECATEYKQKKGL